MKKISYLLCTDETNLNNYIPSLEQTYKNYSNLESKQMGAEPGNRMPQNPLQSFVKMRTPGSCSKDCSILSHSDRNVKNFQCNISQIVL